MELTHTRLLVNKFRECFRFYSDILGFSVRWGDEHGLYADFQAGGNSTLTIFDRKLMAEVVGTSELPLDAETMDKATLIFKVDSVDQWYEKLLAQEVEFATEPMDRPAWGIRFAHFRDPEGTLIEIFEPLENQE
ncbi:VOC family protein [Texcoconibacillus texcoconensis]|uniref:Catechol 2,3-dioxygenase-like lactoylglutathione lyase family enzyme n=1 Tax=Texcoconibacillus texcoconensis TaxID=1095777 RepID=A0A840QTK3_9BACI|nr:VOC family protein [Texcoconibacillus texcoconensis]MBB5174695.1 catechol 2,3-dioxygenase-like lactoylglutathione lyase family enzyme [Texcoconibacillus texcoconensis]